MNGFIKQKRYALVYQGGISNVFEVECWNMASYGREARLLLQSDFRGCGMFAKGLAQGGHLVETFACNRAGDIKNEKWTDDLDSAPFSENFIVVRQTIAVYHTKKES